MTKEQWYQHWVDCGPHNPKVCKECQKRAATRRASRNRRIRAEIYASLGMVRARGDLGGVFYE